MNLAQRDQRPKVRTSASMSALRLRHSAGAKLSQKLRAVALDCGSGVVFGESQIERVAPVCAGESPEARGESVDEPRKFAQV
jgi:hypothetical protein